MTKLELLTKESAEDRALSDMDMMAKLLSDSSYKRMGGACSYGIGCIQAGRRVVVNLGSACHASLQSAGGYKNVFALFNFVYNGPSPEWLEYYLDPQYSPYRNIFPDVRAIDTHQGLALVTTNVEVNMLYTTHWCKQPRIYTEHHETVGVVVDKLLKLGVHPGLAMTIGPLFRATGGDNIGIKPTGGHGDTFNMPNNVSRRKVKQFIEGTLFDPKTASTKIFKAGCSYLGVDSIIEGKMEDSYVAYIKKKYGDKLGTSGAVGRFHTNSSARWTIPVLADILKQEEIELGLEPYNVDR